MSCFLAFFCLDLLGRALLHGGLALADDLGGLEPMRLLHARKPLLLLPLLNHEAPVLRLQHVLLYELAEPEFDVRHLGLLGELLPATVDGLQDFFLGQAVWVIVEAENHVNYYLVEVQWWFNVDGHVFCHITSLLIILN